LDGKTILVHAEHGLGDAVQMARYLPLIAGRGGRVILRCHDELRELFKSLPGIDRLIGEGDRIPAFDVHCPMMSLPFALSTELNSIPAQIPYLRADPNRVAAWRDRLLPWEGLTKIGLVWAGSPQHQYDRQRSIPLTAFAPLSAAKRTVFFSLQKGAASSQRCPSGLNLVDETRFLVDYADTAALISQLDLVVSVDTSVAHVTGALGKAVWILLPLAPDWRWLLNRSDSLWYPTARLFRQHHRGQWEPVIQEVAEALLDLSRKNQ
jgi:hypothetical protein